MRAAPPFRSVSDMCRSSTMAAPRMVARDWSEAIESRATGESLGRSTETEPEGSGASCACNAAPASTKTAASLRPLLCIYVIDRYVAGFRIHVASPDRARGVGRIRHVLRCVHQPQRLSSAAHL